MIYPCVHLIIRDQRLSRLVKLLSPHPTAVILFLFSFFTDSDTHDTLAATTAALALGGRLRCLFFSPAFRTDLRYGTARTKGWAALKIPWLAFRRLLFTDAARLGQQVRREKGNAGVRKQCPLCPCLDGPRLFSTQLALMAVVLPKCSSYIADISCSAQFSTPPLG